MEENFLFVDVYVYACLWCSHGSDRCSKRGQILLSRSWIMFAYILLAKASYMVNLRVGEEGLKITG